MLEIKELATTKILVRVYDLLRILKKNLFPQLDRELKGFILDNLRQPSWRIIHKRNFGKIIVTVVYCRDCGGKFYDYIKTLLGM